MDCAVRHITETDSTNRWIREHDDGQQCQLVWADYQSAGRGSGKNSWESERGKNLLLSVLWHPRGVPAGDQFFVSMAVALAIERVVSRQNIGGVTIKWPNDIYVGDRKICGMLIENKLAGELMKSSIIGIGLNVNQSVFLSDAPNPTSLSMEAKRIFNRENILEQLVKALTANLEMVEDKTKHRMLHDAYHKKLYRSEGVYRFRFADGLFRDCQAAGVDRYGRLQLEWKEHDGHTGSEVIRRQNCDFHDVKFII